MVYDHLASTENGTHTRSHSLKSSLEGYMSSLDDVYQANQEEAARRSPVNYLILYYMQ
jgi:hypothetical protein